MLLSIRTQQSVSCHAQIDLCTCHSEALPCPSISECCNPSPRSCLSILAGNYWQVGACCNNRGIGTAKGTVASDLSQLLAEQVSKLSFKLALEDDLIQSMLGMSPEGSITGDSLARVLQLFGPCMQLSVGTTAVPKTVSGAAMAAAEGGAESEPGVLLNTGEVCNAQISAAHIGYSSLVRSLPGEHEQMLHLACGGVSSPESSHRIVSGL